MSAAADTWAQVKGVELMTRQERTEEKGQGNGKKLKPDRKNTKILRL